MAASTFQELTVYKKAFALSMELFELSRHFPPEEKYALTDQLRRSSRSVCANVAEGFRKRRYPAHFIVKISDADAENAETQVWLEFSKQCHYLPADTWSELMAKTEEIGKLLHHMMTNPEKY